jgi:hypothetical protein
VRSLDLAVYADLLDAGVVARLERTGVVHAVDERGFGSSCESWRQRERHRRSCQAWAERELAGLSAA